MNNTRKKGIIFLIGILSIIICLSIYNKIKDDGYNDLTKEYKTIFIQINDDIKEEDVLEAISVLNNKDNKERIERLNDVVELIKAKITNEHEREYRDMLGYIEWVIEIKKADSEECIKDKLENSRIAGNMFLINMLCERYETEI